uniref:HTH psq-type domain-containing protein n=1 Tax=Octopus bimaculoides TaxID=37653 RepID=A0A0L8IF64_OCTBM
MKRAARKVVDEMKSLRDVAKDFEVNFMTLQRYCKKLRTEGKIASVGYASPRAVFTKEQEDLLVTYILKAAKIYYGLTPSDIRSLAYDYAKANEMKRPDSWSPMNALVLTSFQKTTSLSRATSFNRINVDKFFDNLTEGLDGYKLEGHDIYNCDETGVTTVQRPDRIVAERSETSRSDEFR